MSVHVYDVGGWSSLPIDMLLIILGLLSLTEDIMVFRGVCSSWRSAAKRRDTFLSKVPLLMLAENKGSDTDIREFYSLSKRKICARIPVPDARGDKMCMDVGFGWLITLASSGEVCLVKPFSSARIQLPNFKTFSKYHRDRANPESRFIRRAWLIADPSETSDFTMIVSVNCVKLGFWRNGDESWKRINNKFRTTSVHCYEGKIYLLDMKGKLVIWDPQQTDLRDPQGLVMRVDDAPDMMSLSWEDYLVRSTNGELLVITRNNTGATMYNKVGTNFFRVKRIDLARRVCVEIKDVGKDAIFLGNNAAVSVDATQFPGVLEPNSIYFTDDQHTAYHMKSFCPTGGGKDMGIYYIEDRSIERFDVKSYSRLSPPLWVFPSF